MLSEKHMERIQSLERSFMILAYIAEVMGVGGDHPGREKEWLRLRIIENEVKETARWPSFWWSWGKRKSKRTGTGQGGNIKDRLFNEVSHMFMGTWVTEVIGENTGRKLKWATSYRIKETNLSRTWGEGTLVDVTPNGWNKISHDAPRSLIASRG